MMLARWNIDARFGQKQKVIDSLQAWNRDIGAQIGWTGDKVRIITGSVGVAESRVVSEVLVNDLAELNASWDKLSTIEAHKNWSKELEPYVVSGSMVWEIFRVL